MDVCSFSFNCSVTAETWREWFGKADGPFHDNLGRDATGEGQADESTAAGMGAQHLILGEGLLDSLAGTEAYPGNGQAVVGLLGGDVDVVPSTRADEEHTRSIQINKLSR